MAAVKLTIAEAMDQAKLAIGPYPNADNNAFAAEVIDNYESLIDKPFQAVWDDDLKAIWEEHQETQNELAGIWSFLIHRVLGTQDRDHVALFFTELERIREGMPALGKQGSQIPGDQWASPGRIVCSWPNLDITARAVLFVMAAHGNNKGENIWVSQQRIADYLGVHKRTAQRATERLAQTGAITKTAEPHQHKPTTYKLNRGSKVT